MIFNNIFITGATGLIGKELCRRMAASGAHIIALVRNKEKAHSVLPDGTTLVEGVMEEPWKYSGQIDYIIHMAGITDSNTFVRKPVEVINGTVLGASHLLDFAIDKQVKKLIFISTMEVYGLTDSLNVTENDFIGMDTTLPRNCYPEAKRLSECLFASAYREYGVPAVIARLAQTFGHGVSPEDRRVFAQFATAVRNGKDIVLQSKGDTARCYCSINDAISAILLLLEKGMPGMAYNVANPDTFCTIREMADLVATRFSNGKSRVVVADKGSCDSPYLPSFKMKLNIDRLKSLGWRPKDGLVSMFQEII